MLIELKHPFFKNYPKAFDLFAKCYKIGTLKSRFDRTAEQIAIDPTSINFTSAKTDKNDIANDFRGASFESFTEILLKLMGNNPNIGVLDYQPNFDTDYGVDGVGIGNNGCVKTIQVKSRGWDVVMGGNKDHLHNFVSYSINRFGVNVNDDCNMLIITSAKSINWRDMTSEWQEKVSYIAMNESWGCFRNSKYQPENPCNSFSLKTLLDDNYAFWEQAKKLIAHS